jgi:hypothetical protein
LERRVGLNAAKKAAKKGAKSAIEKKAAKKGAIEKHAGKKAAKEAAKKAAKKSAESKSQSSSFAEKPDASGLSAAFHYLQRASAVVSLLEPDKGGDLRQVLMEATEVYRAASLNSAEKSIVTCAVGLARASEHLAMAGLYVARLQYRVEVDAPVDGKARRILDKLGDRIDKLRSLRGERSQRLLGMLRELVRRVDAHDPHFQFELAMAADGLCEALEAGF